MCISCTCVCGNCTLMVYIHVHAFAGYNDAENGINSPYQSNYNIIVIYYNIE